MNQYFVYVTFENNHQAQDIAKSVVSARLAACANIFAPHQSIYWWEGEVHSAEECAALFKTTDDKLQTLKDEIVKRHSYDVPCVVAWLIEKGHAPFLDWMSNEVP